MQVFVRAFIAVRLPYTILHFFYYFDWSFMGRLSVGKEVLSELSVCFSESQAEAGSLALCMYRVYRCVMQVRKISVVECGDGE